MGTILDSFGGIISIASFGLPRLLTHECVFEFLLQVVPSRIIKLVECVHTSTLEILIANYMVCSKIETWSTKSMCASIPTLMLHLYHSEFINAWVAHGLRMIPRSSQRPNDRRYQQVFESFRFSQQILK